MAKGIQILDLSSPIALEPMGSGTDLLSSQDPLSAASSLIDQYMSAIQIPTVDVPKVKDEVNPNVLLNEQIQQLKEQEEYEKKKEERKVKYKKQPVAEVRGDIYRGDKDENNINVGMSLLAGAGILAGIAALNKPAISRGIKTVNDYMAEHAVQRRNSENVPDGRYYIKNTSIFSPEFHKYKKAKGINTSIHRGAKPMERLGEIGAQMLYDPATHGSQRHLWMIHPIDLMGRAGSHIIDPMRALGGPGQALLLAGAIQPAIALSGAYDITNPSELFRPEGFKQNNPDSEDGRVSTAPAEEMFSRFLLGRTGRPLKYAHAKEEIPDLTIGRYKDYMNYMYRDKGFLNLGLAKSTDENLQGVPEARILGYPITINSLGTFLGGAAGAGIGTSLGYMAGKPLEPEVKSVEKPKPAPILLSEESLRISSENPSLVLDEPVISSDKTDTPAAPKGKKIKKGDFKTMAGGAAGVALGSLAGYFLSKFIEDNIKKGNDAYRQQQEVEEGRARPRGYYVTDGNNQIISM